LSRLKIWFVPLSPSVAREKELMLASRGSQMKRPKLKGCDLETLERIVRDNAKQRFTLRSEQTGGDGKEELWIRANQGHSVKVHFLSLSDGVV